MKVTEIVVGAAEACCDDARSGAYSVILKSFGGILRTGRLNFKQKRDKSGGLGGLCWRNGFGREGDALGKGIWQGVG